MKFDRSIKFLWPLYFWNQRKKCFWLIYIDDFTCAKPAFSKAHGIDNNADPMMVFQIDKMVVNDEFLVPEAIAIAEPLMLSDLKIYRYEIVLNDPRHFLKRL